MQCSLILQGVLRAGKSDDGCSAVFVRQVAAGGSLDLRIPGDAGADSVFEILVCGCRFAVGCSSDDAAKGILSGERGIGPAVTDGDALVHIAGNTACLLASADASAGKAVFDVAAYTIVSAFEYGDDTTTVTASLDIALVRATVKGSAVFGFSNQSACGAGLGTRDAGCGMALGQRAIIAGFAADTADFVLSCHGDTAALDANVADFCTDTVVCPNPCAQNTRTRTGGVDGGIFECEVINVTVDDGKKSAPAIGTI